MTSLTLSRWTRLDILSLQYRRKETAIREFLTKGTILA